MTIKRVEKFKTWSAARQFYSVVISNGCYAVYEETADGFIVTVYE